MKTANRTKQISHSVLNNELYIDEHDGIFDDNWIVSANDLFGGFTPITDDANFLTYYDQAA